MISISGYTIDKKIGSGGMADVYLGHQISIDRPVAIKVMSSAMAVDESFAKRFIKEANVGVLTHPNIITVYDAGKVENNYYIVMEYICGGDLAQKIANQQLTFEQKIEIVKKIAAALGYSYSKGFIHRDVKPENILFREDGTPVLADFGIAKAVTAATNITSVGTIIGSPYYMSPEQTRGQEVDHRSDLYSLGVVLYELLCGYKPFESGDTFAIGIKHINEAVPPLPEPLAQYQSLIDKMLAKDPNQRFQNSEQFVAAVNNMLVGNNATVIQPVVNFQNSSSISKNTGLDRKTAEIGKNSSLIAYLAVFVLLVGVSVGAGFYFMKNSDGDEQETIADATVEDIADRNSKIAHKTVETNNTPTIVRPSPNPVMQAEQPHDTIESASNLPAQNSEKADSLTALNNDKSSQDPLGMAQLEQQKIIEQQKKLEQERIREEQLERQRSQQAAVKLKRQKDKKVASLIAKANRLMQQEKYILPHNDNAHSAYKDVLNLQRNNLEAQEGLKKIKQNIAKELSNALKSNRFTVVESKSRLLLDYPEFIDIADEYMKKLSSAREKELQLKSNELQDKLVGGGKGPVMVHIPAGNFLMGDIRGTDTEGDEKPVHQVQFSNGFAISKFEVTFNQYELFARSTGNLIPNDSGFGKGDRPVINVNWNDAIAYTKWLSKQTGHSYRLPTEAEWEYVARGNTQSDYFWGDNIDRKKANCYGCSGGFDNKKTAEVGTYAENAFGIYDMHGNVWEWTLDCWHDRYDNAPSNGDAWDESNCQARVLRGGSWKTYPLFVRSSNRDWFEPNKSSNQFGFRVVRQN